MGIYLLRYQLLIQYSSYDLRSTFWYRAKFLKAYSLSNSSFHLGLSASTFDSNFDDLQCGCCCFSSHWGTWARPCELPQTGQVGTSCQGAHGIHPRQLVPILLPQNRSDWWAWDKHKKIKINQSMTTFHCYRTIHLWFGFGHLPLQQGNLHHGTRVLHWNFHRHHEHLRHQETWPSYCQVAGQWSGGTTIKTCMF